MACINFCANLQYSVKKNKWSIICLAFKHLVSSHGSMEKLRPSIVEVQLWDGCLVNHSSTLAVPIYVRSNSAIDRGPARRARVRAFTTVQNRGIGAPFPRPGTKRADSVSMLQCSEFWQLRWNGGQLEIAQRWGVSFGRNDRGCTDFVDLHVNFLSTNMQPASGLCQQS